MKDKIERDMENLCLQAKDFVSNMAYEKGKQAVALAMSTYPHRAEPHNLMGILLEEEGDIKGAAKHFRAAWALEPTYRPAAENLEQLVTFSGRKTPLYGFEVRSKKEDMVYAIAYDENKVGHIVKGAEKHDLEQ